ncbi:hypothetical protein CPB83DRAFT_820899 [Crepidotus variabilis]|uniref:DUF4203 domain-containing protein n=1 Tax=Crepidotus variabilis TaxID=179855 RepID=A0A9P6E7G1_9AGAR|nr:hypothetical protein CPB83DRAFT_820899 [Crepidotus variabilis]
MSSSTHPQIQLTPLLPSSPYLLPYALPLLLLSIVFTFAGTFLTLDRTRTFPKKSEGAVYASLPVPGALEPPKKKRKLSWVLEGGVGGLIGGYLFGVHLSTALSLLIPSTTSSSPLSPKPFLAIWLLSTIFTTPLAGRYRHITYAIIPLTGSALLSLSLCLIIHPSLTSRTILTTVFIILFTLTSLLLTFIPRMNAAFFHAFFRICTSSTGAFGLTLSIALLLNPHEASWSNIWERLFVSDGDPSIWASARERGLSAAWGIFFISGIAADWALHRWAGECPDEKWDSYLAQYTTNLPHHSDRAGSFKPFTSVWDRLFPSSSASVPSTPFDLGGGGGKGGSGKKEMMFPNDQDFKAHLTVPFMLHNIPHAPSPSTPGLSPINPGMGFRTTSMSPSLGKLSKKSKSLVGDEESGLLTSSLAKNIPASRTKSKSKNRKTSGGKLGFFNRKSEESVTRTGRKPIKFSADLSSDSEDGDETIAADDDSKKGLDSPSIPSSPVVPTVPYSYPQAQVPRRPGMTRDMSSAATLVERVGGGAGGQRKRGALPLPGVKEDEGVEIDYEKEIEMVRDKLRRNSGGVGSGKNGKGDSDVEYSDYEEDLTTLKNQYHNSSSGTRTPDRDGAWVPGFMKRHSSLQQPTLQQPTLQQPTLQQPTTPMGGALPVPATPSLIRAIDRLAIAQRDAYGHSGGMGVGAGGLSVVPSRDGSVAPSRDSQGQERGHAQDATIPSTGVPRQDRQETGERQERVPRWEEFWREVRNKAQS